MEYELYHHGIKGMRWGVRRYQNKDGTLTEAGKKRVSNYAVSEDSSDFTLNKGTKFQRVGSKNETDNDGRTYVSFGKLDNARYVSYYDSLNATHKLELTALSDVKVAKGKSLIDTYVDMLGDKTPSELASTVTPIYVNGKETRYSKSRRKEALSDYKNAWKNQESFDKSFKQFSQNLMSDTAISKEYFNRLSRKGYQAMYDYNDRNAADNPLIVFNRKNTLKTTRMSEISTKDVDYAIYYLDQLGLT